MSDISKPPKFAIGAVVSLNSGGPEMTVDKVVLCDEGLGYEVMWFDKSDALHRGAFLEVQLVDTRKPLAA